MSSADAPDLPTEIDETTLVARLRAGDEGAYETFVRLYGGRMLSVARRFLGNDDEARDAVQDAMISAFRSIDRFEGTAKISTWLHRIVVNAALMRLRRRKRRPEESLEDVLPRFRDDGHRVLADDEWRVSPEIAVEREEVQVLVRKAIGELPETYRNVLLLRDIEQLDTAEVSQLLGVTENAVKIRLHRARQALRAKLAPTMREL